MGEIFLYIGVGFLFVILLFGFGIMFAKPTGEKGKRMREYNHNLIKHEQQESKNK